MKGECDGKAETKFPRFDIAGPHPIFCKYRKRRAQKEQTCLIFFFIPIFCCPNGDHPGQGKRHAAPVSGAIPPACFLSLPGCGGKLSSFGGIYVIQNMLVCLFLNSVSVLLGGYIFLNSCMDEKYIMRFNPRTHVGCDHYEKICLNISYLSSIFCERWIY